MMIYVVEKDVEWYDSIVNLGFYADRYSAEYGIKKDIEHEKIYNNNAVTSDNYVIIPQILIKYK